MKSLKFSLIRRKIEVELESEQGSQTYYLKEITGRDRDKFLNRVSKQAKVGKDGKPTGMMTNYDGHQSFLVSISLFDSEDKSVPINVIEGFPAATVESLFDAAQELSALTQEGTEEAGND